MHYKAFLLLTFFISSELKSELVVDPGEIVAIKISTCPDIKNKEIADLLNVQYQTTLLIFKDNKEVYRSIGETTKELIYDALNSSI